MYTFGLKRPVYSFGLGPLRTFAYEVTVDAATLQLLGHTLNISVLGDIAKVPVNATLVFTAQVPWSGVSTLLPKDYFLDAVRIEQPLEYIFINPPIDLMTVQQELDSVVIEKSLDFLTVLQEIDNLRVKKELDNIRIQK